MSRIATSVSCWTRPARPPVPTVVMVHPVEEWAPATEIDATAFEPEPPVPPKVTVGAEVYAEPGAVMTTSLTPIAKFAVAPVPLAEPVKATPVNVGSAE